MTRLKSHQPRPNAALDLTDAPRAAMPRNIVPMLAGRAEKAFDHPDWIFEVKWDGYRPSQKSSATPSTFTLAIAFP